MHSMSICYIDAVYIIFIIDFFLSNREVRKVKVAVSTMFHQYSDSKAFFTRL